MNTYRYTDSSSILSLDYNAARSYVNETKHVTIMLCVLSGRKEKHINSIIWLMFHLIFGTSFLHHSEFCEDVVSLVWP